MNTRARRDFLAFTAGAVAAGTVLPIGVKAAEHPDAELLAACAEFDRLELAWCATFSVPEGTDEWDVEVARRERLHEEQAPWTQRIVELHATTPAGHVARARSVMLWDGDDPSGDVNSQFVNERLLGALLRDLIG